MTKELWLAAAQGYLRALDPHSSVISEKAWEKSTKETTDASFEGIGAVLTKRDDNIIVESPIEGQPAFHAGVRAGDIIVKVDDKSVVGMELQPVVKRIKGKKGTKVVLTLRREGEPEDIEIGIVRDRIEMLNVEAKLIRHHRDLGYVKLTGFVSSSYDSVREAIDRLESQTSTGKLRGLVLDLRRNSGGLLEQAVKISDMFLPNGTIVSVRDRLRGGSDKVYTAHQRDTYEMPLIVLVNDGSASASEIVAGAIQDNGRGLVVGERTFGKASVQTLFNPRTHREYYIKLTVARYYAPSGRTIQVLGIQPDIEVAPEVGKPMPLGFREEDLGNHLGAIETEYAPVNAQKVEAVKACAEKRSIAEKIHQADPNPQLRFDYQLFKAADYLECLVDLDAVAHGKAVR
jgi:C-terminal peptidase prc